MLELFACAVVLGTCVKTGNVVRIVVEVALGSLELVATVDDVVDGGASVGMTNG